MEKVYDGLNENKFGIGVFLDLEKAFDMVDRSILIEKLGLYGIRGVELDLFRSYLSNRKQQVKADHITSSLSSVNIGTPQGSCLSPLLFKIFFNDITKCSNLLHFNLFTDDTALYMSHEDLPNLFRNFDWMFT